MLSWLAVSGITEKDKADIIISLKEANYLWVVLAMIAGFFAHLSRAARWKMLFEPLGITPKFNTTFYAVMIGYLGNLALPRLGEILRCGILKRYEKIPFTQSFGTVIAERIIDMLVMFLLFAMSIWVEYARMYAYISENIVNPLELKLNSLAENKIVLLLLVGIIVAASFTFFIFRKKIFQNTVAQKIRKVLLSFLEAIKSVTKVKKPFLFVFHSLFIWAMYLLSVYLCVFAFSDTKTMTLVDCLIIMTFGSLGVIATPGGIGAYQWIVLQIMLVWGYAVSTGIAFGWVVWLAQTVLILLLGFLSFGLLAINNREKSRSQIHLSNGQGLYHK